MADVRRFEIRDGRLTLRLEGADLQILDAMAHRYARNPSAAFNRARVERLRATICDALDRFYLGEDDDDDDEDEEDEG